VRSSFKRFTRASPRHFGEAIVAARAEAKFGHGIFQDLFALGSQHAELPNVARAHLRVRVDVLVEEAAELRIACGDDAMPYGFRRLRDTAAREVFVWNSRHVDLDIDAVINGPEIFDM